MMRWSRCEWPAYQRLQPRPQGLQPGAQRAHRTTSATIEKRSLSPCLVVGDAKLTFLKRFDFPSAVIRSEAERACPSSVSRPAAQVETRQVGVGRDQLGQLLHERGDLRLQALAERVDLLLELVDVGLQLLHLAHLRLDRSRAGPGAGDAAARPSRARCRPRPAARSALSATRMMVASERPSSWPRRSSAGSRLTATVPSRTASSAAPTAGSIAGVDGRRTPPGACEAAAREGQQVALSRQRQARAVPVGQLPAVERDVVRPPAPPPRAGARRSARAPRRRRSAWWAGAGSTPGGRP